ncbi:MAG TPA: carbamoyl-phosphate synthase large subunit, partial [Pseudomonadota bacterium]|nr:carbamoyl-phosphate synthase large subunit [Pseudomonadota bacterium]
CASGQSEQALEDLHNSTGIDRWFLAKLRRIVRMEAELAARRDSLDADLLLEAKRMGFADAQLAQLCQRSEPEIRALRARWQIHPVFKTVDTCAGEFAAQTPYFYSTYETQNEAPPLPGNKKVVLGSGPIRIGQGIEFDYCSVRGAMALHEAGARSILINSNPETVSTDFDLSDRLYFEPLDEESVLAVLDNERGPAAEESAAPAVLVQFGGQTALNLAGRLAARQVPVLGTPPDRIDLAEDRERFDALMAELAIPRPRGATVRSVAEALAVAAALGFPLVVRPSYVLGGRAMEIVRSEAALRRYVERAQKQCGTEHPLLIDRYLRGIEIEVDAICDGEQVLIPGIMRHIERAGVHSGDSFAVYPALGVRDEDLATVVTLTTRLARALGVIGLLNIQFVVTDPVPDPQTAASERPAGGSTSATVFVLEANPRASRTVPFLSKITGVPMVTVATQVMLGATLRELGYAGGLWPAVPLVAIKAPVFSMGKLRGADTALGPEMKSTGEVMGIDFSYRAALQKALLASGIALPAVGAAFLSIADHDKPEALPIAQALAARGYTFYATSGTAAWLHAHGLAAQAVRRISDGGSRIPELIRGRHVALAINTITGGNERIRESGELHDGMLIRRSAVESGVPCFTSLDTARVVVELLAAPAEYELRPVGEYRRPRGAAASAKETP